jgi:hypothetical protein
MVGRWWILVVAALLVVPACASADGETPEAGPPTPPPPPSPSSTPIPPVLYFNLTEEDALDYLEALDLRIEEALHDGDLGALHDLYTSEGPAGRGAAARIISNFRRRVVDRLRYEALSTRVLKIRSQLAVFRQVREVHPCAYKYGDRSDVTPDHRIVREVVIRYMADENLNWKIDREVVMSQEPTGRRVTRCPP